MLTAGGVLYFADVHHVNMYYYILYIFSLLVQCSFWFRIFLVILTFSFVGPSNGNLSSLRISVTLHCSELLILLAVGITTVVRCLRRCFHVKIIDPVLYRGSCFNQMFIQRP